MVRTPEAVVPVLPAFPPSAVEPDLSAVRDGPTAVAERGRPAQGGGTGRVWRRASWLTRKYSREAGTISKTTAPIISSSIDTATTRIMVRYQDTVSKVPPRKTATVKHPASPPATHVSTRADAIPR